MTAEAPTLTPERANLLAWAHGRLSHMLDTNQRDMYARWRATENWWFIYDVGRRVGKSTIMVLSAFEDCFRRPKALIKYGAGTQDMVKEILLPLVDFFLDGMGREAWKCPDGLRPTWKTTDSTYYFGNGAQLKMIGLDLHADRLRGPWNDGVYLDEVAFVDDLYNKVHAILRPQRQKRPWAKYLLGSTPAETPASDWTRYFCVEGRRRAALVHRTILDNPRLSPEEIESEIADLGGRDATITRRELFAEHVVDDSLAVVPEFHRNKANIVKEWPRPAYFHRHDRYVSMDPGFADLTATLFAYYDFAAAKIIIEDELSLSRSNTSIIAQGIRETEARNWKELPVFRRVSDVDLRLISDLWTDHKIAFIPTQKDDKEAALNALRRAIGEGKLIIHPRCENLITHLNFAIWKKSRSGYERTEQYGHFDFVDAAVYLVRNVDRSRNPYPTHRNGEHPSTHHMGRTSEVSSDLGRKVAAAFDWRRGCSGGTGRPRPRPSSRSRFSSR